jgi:PAS domain-containing protein
MVTIDQSRPAAGNVQQGRGFEALIAELAGLAFYEVDFENGVAHVDERLRELCGVPADRTQGLQVLEFWMRPLHTDDRERVLDRRRRLHDGWLERISEEYRFLHPTLGERWIHHVGCVATRGAHGQTLRGAAVAPWRPCRPRRSCLLRSR